MPFLASFLGLLFMRITSHFGLKAMARKAVVASAALALGAAAAVPAHATDYLFDFSNLTSSTQTYSKSSSSNGNIASFTKTASDGSTLSMKMTAWSINPNDARIYNAILNFYSGGAGVDNRNEPNTSPDHSIDNDGDGIDFVVLQFEQKVDLNGIDIGWVENDSDATIRWSPTLLTPWDASLAALHGAAASVLNPFGSTNVLGGSTAGPMRDVTGTGNAMSNLWIISAANPNPVEGTGRWAKSKTDYFKLQALVVSNYPPVPEPASWMMMIAGFGGIGWAMRRRRFSAAGHERVAAGA